MKVVLIRHGQVDMKWEKRYTSDEFDRACENYDSSPIKEIDQNFKLKNTYNQSKIYISTLPRTRETAVRILGNHVFNKSELLNEVPLKSFRYTKSKLPLVVWNVLGRLAWYFNNSSQKETRMETIERAKKVVALLKRNNEDCYIITHGFFLNVLIKELEKEGFKIYNNKRKLNNLDEVVATL